MRAASCGVAVCVSSARVAPTVAGVFAESRRPWPRTQTSYSPSGSWGRTNLPSSSVTTILRMGVGVDSVSAMTQTPASAACPSVHP